MDHVRQVVDGHHQTLGRTGRRDRCVDRGVQQVLVGERRRK